MKINFLKELAAMDFPRRGEIYLVNFDPTIGHETKKVRPALIISKAAIKLHLDMEETGEIEETEETEDKEEPGETGDET
jgi:hypothetical protein